MRTSNLTQSQQTYSKLNFKPQTHLLYGFLRVSREWE
jgi:hypothetical protein